MWDFNYILSSSDVLPKITNWDKWYIPSKKSTPNIGEIWKEVIPEPGKQRKKKYPNKPSKYLLPYDQNTTPYKSRTLPGTPRVLSKPRRTVFDLTEIQPLFTFLDGGQVKFYLKGTPKGGVRIAPKAEDRFRNSTKLPPAFFDASIKYTGTKARGVVQDVPYWEYSPALITEAIAGNDTVYRELPERKRFSIGRLVYRQASSSDKDRSNYLKLKKRFDTAWGLAKDYKNGGQISKFQNSGIFPKIKSTVGEIGNAIVNGAKTLWDESGIGDPSTWKYVKSDLEHLGVLPRYEGNQQLGIINPVFIPDVGGVGVKPLNMMARETNYVTNAAERAARLDFLKELAQQETQNLATENAKALAGTSRNILPEGTVVTDWQSGIKKPRKPKSLTTAVVTLTVLELAPSVVSKALLRGRKYILELTEDLNLRQMAQRRRLKNTTAMETSDARHVNRGRPRDTSAYTEERIRRNYAGTKYERILDLFDKRIAKLQAKGVDLEALQRAIKEKRLYLNDFVAKHGH